MIRLSVDTLHDLQISSKQCSGLKNRPFNPKKNGDVMSPCERSLSTNLKGGFRDACIFFKHIQEFGKHFLFVDDATDLNNS